MKNLILLVMVAVVLVGCGTPNNGGRVMIGNFTVFNPNVHSMLDVPPEAVFLANPVRRSEWNVSNFDGTYTASHSQGTSTYVSQQPTPWGPAVDVSQSTYNNTYVNYTSTPYPMYGSYGTVYSGGGVISGGGGTVVSSPQCTGTVVIRPYHR